ncbi:MAG: hypothetical protein E3K37_10965 [Candidatus Kuenenia sp.]|nr:hypothetical protein [Candidatus Kuenenia hertensis]
MVSIAPVAGIVTFMRNPIISLISLLTFFLMALTYYPTIRHPFLETTLMEGAHITNCRSAVSGNDHYLCNQPPERKSTMERCTE